MRLGDVMAELCRWDTTSKPVSSGRFDSSARLRCFEALALHGAPRLAFPEVGNYSPGTPGSDKLSVAKVLQDAVEDELEEIPSTWVTPEPEFLKQHGR